MSATTRVAAAVAAGYLLGRTKKLKLAITVGSMLAGGRLAGGVKPGALVESLSKNPEVQRLQDQLRGQVLAAAKSAAANVASSRLESLNDSLLGRGANALSAGSDDDEDAGDEPDQDAQDSQETQDEGETEDKPRSKTRSRAEGATKRASGQASKRASSGAQTTKRATSSRTKSGTASKRAASSSSTAKRPARKKSASSSTGR